jgi:threonine aldolase
MDVVKPEVPVREVELRSDTFTRPSRKMLQAMMLAQTGDDVYGEDPTVNTLEERAAQKLGKEAACFMPSGTMANLSSILAHCPRGSKVVVGAESDIYVYEAAGASVCGGVAYHPVPNQADGTLRIEDIEAAFPQDPDDPQFALPALICLENPQNHTGGRVLPTAYLQVVREVADRYAVPIHLDGSRLFNAAVATGSGAEFLASFADSVQFCLSKGLCAPAGSMVVGRTEFIAKVRRIRKMLGGGMRQSGVLAAAGLIALEEMSGRVGRDHATALRLATALSEVPGIRLDPRPLQINMVFFELDSVHEDASGLVRRAAQNGVRLAELGAGRIRCVTHAGVSADDVDYAAGVIAAIVTGAEGPASMRFAASGRLDSELDAEEVSDASRLEHADA